MVAIMGFKRNEVAPYVAESFNVCTEKEYNDALKAYRAKKDKTFDPNDLHTKYNLQIQEMLRGGKQIIMPGIDPDNMNEFTPENQKIINSYFWKLQKYERFSSYINGLNGTQRQEMNTMPKEDVDRFFRQQIGNAEKMSKEFDKGWEWWSRLTLEQISSRMLSTKHDEYLNTFRSNPDFKNIAWTKGKQVDELYENMDIDERKEMLKTMTEEEIKKNLKNMNDYKLLEQSWLLQGEEKERFYAMMKEYSEYSESIGLGEYLKKIWWNIYDKIKNMSIDMLILYDTPIDAMKSTVMEDDNVKTYFKENGIKESEIMSPNNKNFEYYKNLGKLYPEFDVLVKKDPEMKKLMNDDTEEGKKLLVEKLRNNSKVSKTEEMLMEDTNNEIQRQTITGCLDMLQMYMDIDLTEQENVLDQFTLAKTEEKNNLIEKNASGIILKINGKIKGKNITLHYNLNEWTLQQTEFLARWKIDGPFAINHSENGKMDIPYIKLPTFDDFLDGAKRVDYTNVMRDAEDLASYKKKVGAEVKKQVQDSWTRDIDVEKMRFERSILRNIAAQETFLFMRDKEMDENAIDEVPSKEAFSTTDNSDVYGMYTLIYNSLEYYSIENLKSFRANIDKLDTYKDENYIAYINQNEQSQKKWWEHKEKYLLGLVGKQDEVFKGKTSENTGDTYAYLNTYSSFFSLFQTAKGALHVIDNTVFGKFVDRIGQSTSKDQSYMPSDMERKFDAMIDNMESWNIAENLINKIKTNDY